MPPAVTYIVGRCDRCGEHWSFIVRKDRGEYWVWRGKMPEDMPHYVISAATLICPGDGGDIGSVFLAAATEEGHVLNLSKGAGGTSG